MSERTTLIVVRFLGACAIILVSSISWAAAHGAPLDVSASTLAGTVLGGLAGMLTNNHRQPPPEAEPPSKP